jgi:hypothetical protein
MFHTLTFAERHFEKEKKVFNRLERNWVGFTNRINVTLENFQDGYYADTSLQKSRKIFAFLEFSSTQLVVPGVLFTQ